MFTLIKAAIAVPLVLCATAAAYFGLRSKSNRLEDKHKLVSTAKNSYARARQFVNSLGHTEAPAA
jgi:hypothetical protein